MKTENAAARAPQTGTCGENAGRSGTNALNAKPLFGLAERCQQPEHYAIFALIFLFFE
jgi:hypothetical protein